MLLALCTGERRDRASRAWKVVGQIKERVVLPEVRNWHGKACIFGQPYSQGVWGLRFVKRTREDSLHRPRCKGFAQAPCPVSRPTGRVHIIGIPTLLKMEFEGGGVVLKFHFKVPFLQSCFLNDQYSSSFHVIGKQVKIKYLRLAPEELSTCQTEAAHV